MACAQLFIRHPMISICNEWVHVQLYSATSTATTKQATFDIRDNVLPATRSPQHPAAHGIDGTFRGSAYLWVIPWKLKTSAAPHTFNVIAENFNIHPITKRNHVQIKWRTHFQDFRLSIYLKSITRISTDSFPLTGQSMQKVMQLRI